MTRPRGQNRPCSSIEARDRHDHALRFLEAAELVLGDITRKGYSNVAGALAVLAGVAIADAVCCRVLGRHHHGADHQAAVGLLSRVAGVGERMSRDLDRLLGIKDKASYQSGYLSRADARRAVGWARRMIGDASAVLAG